MNKQSSIYNHSFNIRFGSICLAASLWLIPQMGASAQESPDKTGQSNTAATPEVSPVRASELSAPAISPGSSSEPVPSAGTPELRDSINPCTSTSTSTSTSTTATPVTQVENAKSSITGVVTDMSGNVKIGGAHIVITRVGEEHRRFQTESAEDGTFRFDNIDPGKWSMTTSAKEMLSHTFHVDTESGQSIPVKVALEDLEPVDVLRVTGKRTLIHPERIGSTTNVDHRIVNQYGSGNDLRKLVESTPGVMTDALGNIITRGEHNSVNYELDGVILPEAAGVLQQTTFASPRSLQNMQVDIGGYEASDGGGPLGAVVRMKSLPMVPKPTFTIGQQIGGPIAGNIWYNGSTAFSQNPDSQLYKLRFESSGSFRGTRLGLSPPVQEVVHNGRVDINSLSKLEYSPTARDRIRLTIGINSTQSQVPVSGISSKAGVNQRLFDMQNYAILSYRHKFLKHFDEANLHILNAFYYDGYNSRNVFDPNPVINADQPIWSIAPAAQRFNYAFGAQGDISKTIFKTHHLKAGFLTELRSVRTQFSGYYYNADRNNPDVPFGAEISPFTGTTVGPRFTGNIGAYKGFRYLQSAYFQDSWRPQKGILKRLTLDAGVRFDLYHGVFGSTYPVLAAINSIPDIEQADSKPFGTQRVTNAQASGRFGASYVLTKNTVVRGSFSNLFMPPPVDVFVTPPDVSGGATNGIYPGTIRPMVATRGQLVDTSVETQLGPRFVTRTNLFWKYLSNFGDSGVVGNSMLYNRQQLSAQSAYGVETRVDLKPKRDGTGFYGFLSNTLQVAYLRGNRQVTGGNYSFPDGEPVLDKFPDHDRRSSTVAAFGYQSKNGLWVLPQIQVLTGLQDLRDVELFGRHNARTPVLPILNLSAGWNIPASLRQKSRGILPNAIDLRIENLTNVRRPTNLGSPFQGTRYLLPFRFLIGCNWTLGHQDTKVSEVPAKSTISQANRNLRSPCALSCNSTPVLNSNDDAGKVAYNGSTISWNVMSWVVRSFERARIVLTL